MAKKYYAWKNAECNGNNPEWIEMNGYEFMGFIRKEENKHRLFICLNGEHESEQIVIETNEEHYKKWRKENNHSQYLKKFEENRVVLSLDCPMEKTDDCTLEETISDDNIDFVEELLLKELKKELHKAIAALSEKEKQIILLRYFLNNNLTIRDIAKQLNLSKSSAQRLIDKAEEKIKNFLGQIEN